MLVIRAIIYKILYRIANREDPDQTAEAVWSESTLFVYAIFASNYRSEFLNIYRNIKDKSRRIGTACAIDALILFANDGVLDRFWIMKRPDCNYMHIGLQIPVNTFINHIY